MCRCHRYRFGPSVARRREMENPDAVGYSEAAAACEINQPWMPRCAHGGPTGAKAPVARCWSGCNSLIGQAGASDHRSGPVGRNIFGSRRLPRWVNRVVWPSADYFRSSLLSRHSQQQLRQAVNGLSPAFSDAISSPRGDTSPSMCQLNVS
jgi:hypothetical protein